MSIISLKTSDTKEEPSSTGAARGAGMDRVIEKRALSWPVKAGLAGAAVIIAVGLYVLVTPPAGRTLTVENAKVSVSAATRGAFEDFIPVRGRVTPLKTVFLDAIEGGRVEQIYVEDGAAVKAGDVLVDLSNTQLQLDVLSRETEVAQQINNMRSLELSLSQTRFENRRNLVETDYQIQRLSRLLERRRALFAKGNAAESDLQNVEDEFAYQKNRRVVLLDSKAETERLQVSQLVQLKDTTSRLQQNLELARRNLEGLKVRAPIDGKLTAFKVEIGQSLPKGERLGQIDMPSATKIVAEIDEFYLNRVDIGQKASLALNGTTYALELAKTYPQVREGRFTADLVFLGPQPSDVRRGQTVQTKLTLGDTTEALLIPDGAFYQDTGGNWVFVVAADGRQAARRTVRMGRRNAKFIEVLSGLEAGEQVITSPYTGFLDKDRLQLTP